MGHPRHQPITEHEKRAVSAMRDTVGDFALLRVTPTGLEKRIVDANRRVREYFRSTGFHEYDGQPQGDAGRVLRPASLLDATGRRRAVASLYRPKTKAGDPRLWIGGLPELAAPYDLLALTVLDGELIVTNLSAIEVVEPTATDDVQDPQLQLAVGEPRMGSLPPGVKRILVSDPLDEPNVSEALKQLQVVASAGWVEGDGHGDTAVGRTLETVLGIPMNSREKPDLLGCELKAYRNPGNRVSLFSKAPDWSRSRMNSSGALVRAFGIDYESPGGKGRRIRHTVRFGKPNSYGLLLGLDRNADELHLLHDASPGSPAVRWDLQVLRAKLASKHRTTFWLRAETRQGPAGDQFRYVSARLTRDPRVELLDDLIEEGVVTLDLRLTLRTIGTGGGDSYLFKLGPKDFDLLFPVSEVMLAID
jgi:hypothetical protein